MPAPVKQYTHAELAHPYPPSFALKATDKPSMFWTDTTIIVGLLFLIMFVPNPLNY